jgi:hypothetical protein
MAGSPLCEPAFLQLARDRKRQSYVLSWNASQQARAAPERDTRFEPVLEEDTSVLVRTGSPLCGALFPQVDSDSEGRSKAFTWLASGGYQRQGADPASSE